MRGCYGLRDLRLAYACTTCFNRAAARLPLFRKEADYAAFERVMLEAYEMEKLAASPRFKLASSSRRTSDDESSLSHHFGSDGGALRS